MLSVEQVQTSYAGFRLTLLHRTTTPVRTFLKSGEAFENIPPELRFIRKRFC